MSMHGIPLCPKEIPANAEAGVGSCCDDKAIPHLRAARPIPDCPAGGTR
jgi:hypothetical protein